MDLLRGLVVARDRPDLAVAVLRTALDSAPDVPSLRLLVTRTLADTLDLLGQADEAQRLRAESA